MKSQKVVPWKLIIFIALILLILVFIGFNLDNRTTVSFGIVEITNASSAIVIIFTLIGGLIIGVISTLLSSKKKSSKTASDDKPRKEKKSRKNKRKDVSNTLED